MSFPPFAEFVSFVAREANIACDPVTSLTFKNPSQGETTSAGRTVQERTKRPVALVTGVKETSATTNLSANTQTDVCLYCEKKNHFLDDCKGFLEKSLDERKAFAVNNKLFWLYATRPFREILSESFDLQHL